MKPSQEFTIKVLSSEDFDKLPYPNAKSSLGMSVMATKTAYIRETGVKDLDVGTLNHEFDELMQQTSAHEIDGIRYKGFIDFIKAIGPQLLFGAAAPAAQAVMGAIRGGGEQQQQQQAPQQIQQPSYTPSSTTQAFAPQTQKPLSLEAYNTSLANLDKNAASREANVMERFRGLGTTKENSAFARTLGNTQKSSQMEREQFIKDQQGLGSTFAK